MEIEKNTDGTFTVSIAHCVVVGNHDPFFNFRQYIEDLIKQFDAKMTQTLHQVVLEK